jgi:hypothetical protein
VLSSNLSAKKGFKKLKKAPIKYKKNTLNQKSTMKNKKIIWEESITRMLYIKFIKIDTSLKVMKRTVFLSLRSKFEPL